MFYLFVCISIISIFVIVKLRNSTKQTYVIIRKLGQIILTVAAFLILYRLDNIKFDIFSDDNILSLQFNIITINSIIAGFLFTSLSIIISVSEKEIIKELYNIDVVDNIMYNLSIGIGSSLFSIVMALLIIFVKLSKSICHFIYLLQVNSVAISITFFCLSFLDILFILSAIRPKEDPKKQERLNATIDKIKQDEKKRWWKF